MSALLEYVFLKSVRKYFLISFAAGSVPEVILPDIGTFNIQTLDCSITQDGYSYDTFSCIQSYIIPQNLHFQTTKINVLLH